MATRTAEPVNAPPEEPLLPARADDDDSLGRLRALTADLRERFSSVARPVGLAFIVAAAGAAVAIVASRSSGGHNRAAATTPAIPPKPVHTTKPIHVAPPRAARQHRAKPVHPAKPAHPKAARAARPAWSGSWPAGKVGWTVVLVSLPTGNGRAAAAARAGTARAGGLAKVGVIDSRRFRSLRSGFYVVFAGVYDTLAQAERAAAAAQRAGFGGAYPRRIAG